MQLRQLVCEAPPPHAIIYMSTMTESQCTVHKQWTHPRGQAHPTYKEHDPEEMLGGMVSGSAPGLLPMRFQFESEHG